jgi:hypothetical protein
MTPEGVDDLLEQTHEVARTDHDRRLTTNLAAFAVPLHLVAIMFASASAGHRFRFGLAA